MIWMVRNVHEDACAGKTWRDIEPTYTDHTTQVASVARSNKQMHRWCFPDATNLQLDCASADIALDHTILGVKLSTLELQT